jgi:hypothetical protein
MINIMVKHEPTVYPPKTRALFEFDYSGTVQACSAIAMIR